MRKEEDIIVRGVWEVGDAEMRRRGDAAKLRSGTEKRSCGRSRCNNLKRCLADTAGLPVKLETSWMLVAVSLGRRLTFLDIISFVLTFLYLIFLVVGDQG